MPQVLPFNTTQLTTVGALESAALIHTPAALDIIEFSGSLRNLISGTFSVELRDQDGALISTLEWTSAGLGLVVNTIDPAYTIPANGHLRIDVTGVGVGAGSCYVTTWALSG